MLEKNVRFVRFRDQVDARLAGEVHLTEHMPVECAAEEHGERGVELADAVKNKAAVHAGHNDIEDSQVDGFGVRFKYMQCIEPIFRNDEIVPGIGKDPAS